ncbi:MAG: hypothetical protein WBD03_03055 [Thermoplasmata archaeon]
MVMKRIPSRMLVKSVAFQHDAVMTLYEPVMAARSELNGASHGLVAA